MSEKYDYDVVIIGAGISGLVCGCYLKKAGLKTLIVEKNPKAGGYCTSFERGGYNFDSAVHYIGGVRDGSLSTILKDLDPDKELKFNQFDPSDKVIIPDSQVYVRANPNDTINEFKKSFVDEKKNIEDFFNFIINSELVNIYRKTANLTFDQLLNKFFTNKKLKVSIGILLMGNMGLPLSKISAFAAVVFFKEFLLDPGYYPIGGMQAFSDYFAKRFKELGGELILSKRVEKIRTSGNNVVGVSIESGLQIKSKVVISGIDASETFNDLLDSRLNESNIVDKLEVSKSVFIVYIGLKNDLHKLTKDTCNIWFHVNDDLEDQYNLLEENFKSGKVTGAMLSFPSFKDPARSNLGVHTIQIFSTAPFISESFWRKNKTLVEERLITFAERIIPNLKPNIDLKIAASPLTLRRYTSNKYGAAFGWASTKDQFNTTVFPQVTSARNLFIIGHWSVMGCGQGGVSTVALSGKKGAELTLGYLKNNIK